MNKFNLTLRIRFNILEPNTQRFDITSLGSLSKMVLLLLSLFTLMIRRLICLPNLLRANNLNSFVKTLMSSPWIDFFLSSFLFMYLHLVLRIALFNLFLFVFFSVLVYSVFHKNKNQKNTKIVCVMCTLVLVYLGWPLKQSFLKFVSFVAQMSISMHN